MVDKVKNVLIANGHELIGQLSWPTGGGKKWHPYTIDEARETLHPQIQTLLSVADNTPKEFAPRGEITASMILHPAYLAKSYFPGQILREAGLVIVGSKPVKIHPRKIKKAEDKLLETASIFISGTADSFNELDVNLLNPRAPVKHQEQFSRIELIDPYTAGEKLRINPNSPWIDYLHVTLHATEADADILLAFRELVSGLGGRVLDRGFRFVPGLTFVAVQIPPDQIVNLAGFTRLRLIRSLPELQSEVTVDPDITKSYKAISIPDATSLSQIKTAIFDGGIANAFPNHAVELAHPSQPQPSAKELSHGVNVTSAFLYGSVAKDSAVLPRPFSQVDHYRVLPSSQSPEQALDVLDKVINGLRSAKIAGSPYRFANISLGPVATFFDDDVHEWTSRLDNELSDGQTLCTVAVGNNGHFNDELGRIQPPGDAVNAFAIGAANSSKKKWNRAPYSAFGPGRSPGFVKPDVVAFGGSQEEPVPIFNPLAGSVVAVAGTSFASPLALRAAVGADVISGSVFNPITLQALMINSAEFSSRSHSRDQVGWGRVALDPDSILYTDSDTVRIVYQGVTRPGHPQKALIPIPPGLPKGTKVNIGATFCYRAPVDSAHAINYTRAGLWVRAYKAPKKSWSLFGSKMYKTEAELRRDSMRWDTVLHNIARVDSSDLSDPYFHINYQVRDEGEAVRLEDAVPMPYALIVTIQVPGMVDLLTQVQAHYVVVK